jgi:uncharacterized protein
MSACRLVYTYSHATRKENVENCGITESYVGSWEKGQVASMTVHSFIILAVAGLLGGIANSMAGGASLVTYPAMMAAGLPPIAANASNTVGLIPGNLIGAWSERQQLPPFDRLAFALLVVALVGGALGAVLLLYTPERVFVLVVPALIGLATVIFAFAKPIQLKIAQWFGADHGGLRAGLIFPAALYGGYFGAGVGVILMAVLSATSSWELRSANAMKNVLGFLANGAAIVIFLFSGLIHWPETLVMMSACVVGGFLGGAALKVVSAAAMRKVIVAVGVVMTVSYGWMYWF